MRGTLVLRATLALSAISSIFGLAACDDDGDRIVGGGGVPVGIVLEVVSGDDQEGKTLEALPKLFVVRAESSNGIRAADVPIVWRVGSGLGGVEALDLVTDSLGFARAQFTSGAELGESTILASVPEQVGGSADFRAVTTVWVITITRDRFVAPSGGDTLYVAKGQLIEWVNRDSLPHGVVAIRGPGFLFDSGVLRNSERFLWQVPVPGVWDYTDPLREVLPLELVNQIAASQAPPPPLDISRP